MKAFAHVKICVIILLYLSRVEEYFMIISFVALLTMLCSVIVLLTGFKSVCLSGTNKASLACSALFLLYLPNTKEAHSFLLFKLLISSCLVTIYSFLRSSKHFVISLDIVSFFSSLIILLYNNLKIAKPFSAK